MQERASDDNSGQIVSPSRGMTFLWGIAMRSVKNVGMSDTSEVSEPEVCTPVTDYVLSVRSYAPFPRFGGGFEGDNRGPSTSRSATSRVAVEIMFNSQSGRIGKPMATSSGTTWLPLNVRGLAEPRVTLVGTSRIPTVSPSPWTWRGQTRWSSGLRTLTFTRRCGSRWRPGISECWRRCRAIGFPTPRCS
jgi:hypothetical protein